MSQVESLQARIDCSLEKIEEWKARRAAVHHGLTRAKYSEDIAIEEMYVVSLSRQMQLLIEMVE